MNPSPITVLQNKYQDSLFLSISLNSVLFTLTHNRFPFTAMTPFKHFFLKKQPVRSPRGKT